MPKRPVITFRRATIAIFLAILWIALGLFTVSPDLHHLLHKDSQSASHTCVLTQFNKGPLLADSSGPAAITPPDVSERVILFGYQAHFVSSDHLLPSTRGPPAIISSSKIGG